MRKAILVALFGLTVSVTAVSASAAGLPNLGPAANGTLPIYKGFYG